MIRIGPHLLLNIWGRLAKFVHSPPTLFQIPSSLSPPSRTWTSTAFSCRWPTSLVPLSTRSRCACSESTNDGAESRSQLISCLLIAFPLGSVFVRIPASQPALKHLFNIAITLFYFFPVLKVYGVFFQLLASVLATYAVAKYDRSSRMPWLVFAYATHILYTNLN